MNPPTTRQLIRSMERAIALCAVGLLLIGISSTFLVGLPAGYTLHAQYSDVGQIMDKVTASHPNSNISFSDPMAVQLQLQIQGFTTNETPITFRVYCFSCVLSDPCVFERSNLSQADQITVDIFGDAIIDITRESQDALFIYWLTVKEYLLKTNPGSALFYEVIMPLVFVTGIVFLVASLPGIRKALKHFDKFR